MPRVDLSGQMDGAYVVTDFGRSAGQGAETAAFSFARNLWIGSPSGPQLASLQSREGVDVHLGDDPP